MLLKSLIEALKMATCRDYYLILTMLPYVPQFVSARERERECAGGIINDRCSTLLCNPNWSYLPPNIVFGTCQHINNASLFLHLAPFFVPLVTTLLESFSYTGRDRKRQESGCLLHQSPTEFTRISCILFAYFYFVPSPSLCNVGIWYPNDDALKTSFFFWWISNRNSVGPQ